MQLTWVTDHLAAIVTVVGVAPFQRWALFLISADLTAMVTPSTLAITESKQRVVALWASNGEGNEMTASQCVCGFIADEADGQTIADHLLEVFVPEDDKGTDGLVHLEGERSLTCLCGLTAASSPYSPPPMPSAGTGRNTTLIPRMRIDTPPGA